MQNLPLAGSEWSSRYYSSPDSIPSQSLFCAGLLLRAWASGHLRKEKELTISGPYQYTRNPLYLGSLVIGAAIVIGCRSWWIFVIFILYFLLFYPVAVLFEQEKMIALFTFR